MHTNIIQPGVKYSVREIVSQGWIRTILRKPADRLHIYRLIRERKLKARNVSIDPRHPRYVVLGSAILSYKQR